MHAPEDGETGEAETGDGPPSALDDAGAPQPSWAALHNELIRNAGAGDDGAEDAVEAAAADGHAEQAVDKLK